MRFEVKIQNKADKRRWDISQYDRRIEVVRALGCALSPKDVEGLQDGKWRYIKKDRGVRVIK